MQKKIIDPSLPTRPQQHNTSLTIKREGKTLTIGRDQSIGFTIGGEFATMVRTPAHSITQAVTTKHKRSPTGGFQLIGRRYLLYSTRIVELCSTVIGYIGKVGEIPPYPSHRDAMSVRTLPRREGARNHLILSYLMKFLYCRTTHVGQYRGGYKPVIREVHLYIIGHINGTTQFAELCFDTCTLLGTSRLFLA